MTFLLNIYAAIAALVSTVVARLRARTADIGPNARPALGGEQGQATAEYALVLLGAAAIALLLAAWAAKSGAISRLFDAVVDRLISDVS